MNPDIASPLWHALRDWANAALGLVYPEVCQICESQRATPDEGYVCAACASQVRVIAPPFCERCGMPFEGDITVPFECDTCMASSPQFCRARAAVTIHPPVLDIIHRYKYLRALWFEPFLANLLVQAAQPVLATEHWDALVPVPLHGLKQREREFNQAERLGRRLALATGIPLRTDLLRQHKATPSQTHLSREDRARNVERAFSFEGRGSVKGQRFVLLDDVFTTGATTNACANVLCRAGAESVCVWTVARGVRRSVGI